MIKKNISCNLLFAIFLVNTLSGELQPSERRVSEIKLNIHDIR